MLRRSREVTPLEIEPLPKDLIVRCEPLPSWTCP